MHAATLKSNRYPFMKQLAHPISHYLRNNIIITNSGVAWQRRSSSARRSSVPSA